MIPMHIRVTVVFSPHARVVHEVALDLPEGATVAQAITASGWAEQVCDLPGAGPLLGIWGRKAAAGANEERTLKLHMTEPTPASTAAL